MKIPKKNKGYKKILKNIYAGQILRTLLNEGPYLPTTGSALDYSSISLIINDIIINKRKKIVEFGSGISTIILARLAKKNNLKINVYSIDNDKNWLNIIKDIIDAENLGEYVKLIHAPLKKNKKTKSIDNLDWYDENIINEKIKELKFDCVIVDGPYANSKEKETARYSAHPFILEKLESRYSFFLDDANRKGERKIINIWEKNYGIKFKIKDKQLAYYTKGDYYNFTN